MDVSGKRHDVPVTIELYREAKEAGLTLGQLINTKFSAVDAQPDLKLGTVFQQVCASTGLVLVGENPFGRRSPMLADILDGKCGYNVAANVQKRSDPYGNEARSLFPAAVIEMIEDRMQPDRVTDNRIFRSMIALNTSVSTDNFVQPVITYSVPGGGGETGLSGARASRITENGNTPMMLTLGTSERSRQLPTYGIGIEASAKALAGTSLDMLVMTVDRYTSIEMDGRVYGYLSALFNGDVDSISGAVPVVQSSSLDPLAVGNKFTHKAWVKFLARKHKYRHITHVIADSDTYLKFEQREGRPGSNNYDPTLERIDPQAKAINNIFGGDVQWWIVEPATEGGPVPANTIWALDKNQAIMMVKNLSADYRATEEFVLQRKSAMVWHWGEDCFRLWGDSELTPFDAMYLSD
jgi:hypothetical protein